MVYPDFPECVGVFRCVERPTYDEPAQQADREGDQGKGRGKLEDLFASDDMWTVEAK